MSAAIVDLLPHIEIVAEAVIEPQIGRVIQPGDEIGVDAHMVIGGDVAGVVDGRPRRPQRIDRDLRCGSVGVDEEVSFHQLGAGLSAQDGIEGLRAVADELQRTGGAQPYPPTFAVDGEIRGDDGRPPPFTIVFRESHVVGVGLADHEALLMGPPRAMGRLDQQREQRHAQQAIAESLHPPSPPCDRPQTAAGSGSTRR